MIVAVNVGVTVGDKVTVWVTTGKVKVGDKIFSINNPKITPKTIISNNN